MKVSLATSFSLFLFLSVCSSSSFCCCINKHTGLLKEKSDDKTSPSIPWHEYHRRGCLHFRLIELSHRSFSFALINSMRTRVQWSPDGRISSCDEVQHFVHAHRMIIRWRFVWLIPCKVLGERERKRKRGQGEQTRRRILFVVQFPNVFFDVEFVYQWCGTRTEMIIMPHVLSINRLRWKWGLSRISVFFLPLLFRSNWNNRCWTSNVKAFALIESIVPMMFLFFPLPLC